MTRRDFFRRASVIAAGLVAADQLELLDRLSHRKLWALGGVKRAYVDQFGREYSLQYSPAVFIGGPPVGSGLLPQLQAQYRQEQERLMTQWADMTWGVQT